MNIWTILIIAAVLGIIPAFIARSKGRSFFGWWVYGFLLFIVAFIHSLIIGPAVEEDRPLLERMDEKIEELKALKKCPFCAEMIKKEAKICRYCGKEV